MGNKFTPIILQATDKVAEGLTDTLLFLFFVYGASFGKQGSLGIHRAFEEAKSALGDCNYQQIKHAISNLAQNNYISRSPKRSTLEIEITKLGKKRIASMIPSYQEKRPWDGHVYLISYDIPNKRNAARNLLREYIRRTGGALLQESLWLNPYNPTELLEEFTRTRHIEGTLLISKLGHDGAVGNETLQELIHRVYHLDDLKKRYEGFLETYSHQTSRSPITLPLDYIDVLKTDPQLPFELLPKNFPAQKAYRLYQQFMTHITT